MSFKQRLINFNEILNSFEITTNQLNQSLELEEGLLSIFNLILEVRESGNRLYVVGNGGSSAIASHFVVDMINVARVPAFTLHEPALITCMSNDYGYENSFARTAGLLIKRNDILVAISSSGNSRNICLSAAEAKKIGASVITLTGFDPCNELRTLGDINLWLNARDYGFVEVGHQFILHNIADRFGS